jgi:hypothetical protein
LVDVGAVAVIRVVDGVILKQEHAEDTEAGNLVVPAHAGGATVAAAPRFATELVEAVTVATTVTSVIETDVDTEVTTSVLSTVFVVEVTVLYFVRVRPAY